MKQLDIFGQESNPLSVFHNTTDLKGKELKEVTFRAGTQNQRVLDFFTTERLTERFIHLTVNHAHSLYCYRYSRVPESSIVRAMSDLKRLGFIEWVLNPDGSPFMMIGEYGDKVHVYQLAK